MCFLGRLTRESDTIPLSPDLLQLNEQSNRTSRPRPAPRTRHRPGAHGHTQAPHDDVLLPGDSLGTKFTESRTKSTQPDTKTKPVHPLSSKRNDLSKKHAIPSFSADWFPQAPGTHQPRQVRPQESRGRDRHTLTMAERVSAPAEDPRGSFPAEAALQRGRGRPCPCRGPRSPPAAGPHTRRPAGPGPVFR